MISRSIQCHQTDHCPVFFHLQGPNIAAIVAPTVILGVLAIVLAVLAWLLCVVKKKRQTEGTYRPSAEEQSGVSSVAAPDALKLPKEERLIWHFALYVVTNCCKDTGWEHLRGGVPAWQGSLLVSWSVKDTNDEERHLDAWVQQILRTTQHFKEALNNSSAQLKQELQYFITTNHFS